MISCLKKLNKKIYSKETSYLLNYVTLHIKNQEIKQAIDEHRTNLIYRIYWPIVCLCVGTFILNVITFHLIKIGHPFLVVTGSCIVLIAILLTIFKKIQKKNLSRYLLIPYFMIAGIGTSLVY